MHLNGSGASGRLERDIWAACVLRGEPSGALVGKLDRMMNSSEIQDQIKKFVSGEDVSTDEANIIEVALDDCYPSDDYVQETVEMIAMYRPEGGEFMFDIVTIQHRLAETMDHLRKMV